MKRAIVLLSGGLDSATVLAIAREQGYEVLCLFFRYGQRHAVEEDCSYHQAGVQGASIRAVELPRIGGSALTGDSEVPDAGSEEGIPSTYVPLRNTQFLSIAAGIAEAEGIKDIFIGANAFDYSGSPDCRPEFIHHMERAINAGSKSGDLQIHAPLIQLTKAEIIQRGAALGVDYGRTHSCYNPSAEGLACGKCDSCVIRRSGFEASGVPDPTMYEKTA